MAHIGVLWAIVLAGALVSGGGDLTGAGQVTHAPAAITPLPDMASAVPRRRRDGLRC